MFNVLNKTYHAITNRLVTPPEFGSVTLNAKLVEDKALDSLRKDLGLFEAAWLYYTKFYLSLIRSFPELQRAFEDNYQTYDLESLNFKPVTITNGVRLKNVWEKFNPPIAEVPVPTSIKITRKDDYNVTIETGSVKDTVRYVYNNQNLNVQFPIGYNIKGDLYVVDNSWTGDKSFEILFESKNFPIHLILEKVGKNRNHIPVLQRAGLLEHYIKAPSLAEKLAITVASIGYLNKTVYYWIK